MSNGSKMLFTDLEQELEQEPLRITGVFPEWLEGTLFRNGPAKFLDGHLFDGLAMIHKFTFNRGRVTYTNRFLRTPAYEQVMKHGKMTSGFASQPGTEGNGHNANVSIVRMDHHFAAMTEAPDIVAFDPCSLNTLGVLPYGDDLPAHYTTAHPHYDFRQKSLFNFTVEFGKTCSYHLYGIPNGTRRRKLIATVETPTPAYMHSFAMTENYMLLVEFPLIFNPQELMQRQKSIAESMHWMPEKGTRFLVVGKQSGKLERVFESDPFFSFHLINAYEKQGEIFIDACAMKRIAMGSIQSSHMSSTDYDPSNQPAMLRFRLSPGSFAAKVERLSEETMEFPGIHYRWSNATDYRYAYGTSTNRQRPESVENQLIKVDTHRGTVKIWHQEGHYPGEPVFAPTPSAETEDDGVILSVVLDGSTGRSYLLALDAGTFEELGRAEVPHHIPISHTSSLTALSAAAIVPLCDTLYSLIKTRKADVFSGFIFLGLVLGIIAVLLGGDERFILLRESYVTGIMGLLFLISLLWARPLIYYFAERFTGDDPQMNEKWGRLPSYRQKFRIMTAV